MASTSLVRFLEGQQTSRPPHFDGSNSGYCKCRMTIFLQAIDFSVWHIVVNPYTPPKTDYTTWTDETKRAANLNAKAMNVVYCAIDQNEFNRILV